MTEQQEKKERSEARKCAETVQSAFVMGGLKISMVRMRICNHSVVGERELRTSQRREVKCRFDLDESKEMQFP